uniref:HotDog ACOT-type domain-containing protein n=1 Tax=Panagrolaimus davidi TaxID=227884 RepID=A0A914PZX2_9BILA
MLKLLNISPFIRRLSTTVTNNGNGKLPTILDLREAMFKHVSTFADIEFDPNKSHPPSASRTSCIIPLKSEPDFQIRYLNASGHPRARFGLLLEDLDTFAVWLAFRHNQELGKEMGKPAHHPMLIVTASVDKIEMKNKVIRHDLDIIIDVLTAKFVMVSQDPKTRKSVRNTPLLLETEEDKENFQRGELAKNTRIARESNSLLRTLPTNEEKGILHQLFLKTIKEGSHTFQRHLPPNHIWMQDAKLKNSIICFPVKQNLYGKIFGGFIMRAAFETAFANVAIISKSRPHILEVDNIMFKNPVEVGSLLLLNSRVCYSTGNLMQTSVDCSVFDIKTGDAKITNTFQFTFEADEDGEVPTVIPRTYEDGILYLDGRRHAENRV